MDRMRRGEPGRPRWGCSLLFSAALLGGLGVSLQLPGWGPLGVEPGDLQLGGITLSGLPLVAWLERDGGIVERQHRRPGPGGGVNQARFSS